MQLVLLTILLITFTIISKAATVKEQEKGLVKDGQDEVKQVGDLLRYKREVGTEQGLGLLMKEEDKRAPMRFGKRAPMRFGKRAPMRFGKRDSDIDNDVAAIEFLRSVRAPMRFGKRSYSFTKKAPMRFGKRAPMRFGKRDIEEPENTDEDYDDVIFSKRAPMRFGKRNYYDDYAEYSADDV